MNDQIAQGYKDIRMIPQQEGRMPVRVRTVGNGSVPIEAGIFKVIHRTFSFFLFYLFLISFLGIFENLCKPLKIKLSSVLYFFNVDSLTVKCGQFDG